MLPPNRVTLAEPVAALLVGKDELIRPKCTENRDDTEPTPRPKVKENLLLPAKLKKLWHSTNVSDSHVDRSHVVCPADPKAVYAASPMLAPCTVTLADPVDALLVLRTMLSMPTSKDRLELTLPYLAPTLIPTSRLPITPCPTWHRSDVSASHVVRSHAVLPTLIEAVYVASPRLDPCTVTLDDPVAARLRRLDTLTMLSPQSSPVTHSRPTAAPRYTLAARRAVPELAPQRRVRLPSRTLA
eukprot:CAMPEP_0172206896 /NCGR_PEP_ID=MMETSP1050-20130122/33499_1 /TAXON_ID=233186 /ORGANISM="Cryptomonas curvata, Strain CCAP979/52" /LENGTH=241 /DNA_ID=CAMNT_0012886083 /DNA_START=1011 /DNA_END=1734 /DNA_ORIENTATION=+